MPLGNVTIKAKFLKKPEIADKKELHAAIEQAKIFRKPIIREESWAEFQKVFAKVTAVLNNKEASAEEVKSGRSRAARSVKRTLL